MEIDKDLELADEWAKCGRKKAGARPARRSAGGEQVMRSTVVVAALAIAMSQPAVRREFGRDHPYSHQTAKPHGDAERIAAAHAKRERKNARRKAAKAILEGGTSNA
jgi:hypothetical protein